MHTLGVVVRELQHFASGDFVEAEGDKLVLEGDLLSETLRVSIAAGSIWSANGVGCVEKFAGLESSGAPVVKVCVPCCEAVDTGWRGKGLPQVLGATDWIVVGKCACPDDEDEVARDALS